ncbi:auxin response factor 4-like protein, partial [Tanacetum coccineum]
AGLFDANVMTGLQAFQSHGYDSFFRQLVSVATEDESFFDNSSERKRQAGFGWQPGRGSETSGYELMESEIKDLAYGQFLKANGEERITTKRSASMDEFCMDESPQQRFIGVVTGVGDMDPYEWSNSKRRCLMVRWDEAIGNDHRERISPWDIDLPGGSFPMLNIQSSPRSKKMHARMHAAPSYLPMWHVPQVNQGKVCHRS